MNNIRVVSAYPDGTHHVSWFKTAAAAKEHAYNLFASGRVLWAVALEDAKPILLVGRTTAP